MELSPELQDRLERYVLGRMGADEADAFEAECANDADLAEALALERQIRLLARATQLADLGEALRAARRRRALLRPLYAFTATAAAAVILLLLYIGFLREPSYVGEARDIFGAWDISLKSSSDTLAEDSLCVAYWRGGIPDPGDSLGMAIRHLRHERSSAAVLVLNSIAPIPPERAREAKFFLGLALAMEQQLPEATREMEAYVASAKPYYKEQAQQWLDGQK